VHFVSKFCYIIAQGMSHYDPVVLIKRYHPRVERATAQATGTKGKSNEKSISDSERFNSEIALVL
jgi:hypothetical protein